MCFEVEQGARVCAQVMGSLNGTWSCFDSLSYSSSSAISYCCCFLPPAGFNATKKPAHTGGPASIVPSGCLSLWVRGLCQAKTASQHCRHRTSPAALKGVDHSRIENRGKLTSRGLSYDSMLMISSWRRSRQDACNIRHECKEGDG